MFTTESLIEDKDFQTLLDIIFENWKFHFISENKLRNALLEGYQ
jgi:hypothetical protein